MKNAIALLLIAVPLVCAEDSLRMDAPEIRLWPHGAPGSEGMTSAEKWNPSTDGFHRITNVHNPAIFAYLPPPGKATGAAFVIAPGGAHRYLVMDLEGSLVAKRLNEMGVAAFILKSRLAKAPGSKYRIEVESLADTQRALRLVRSRAQEWNVDPGRVGIMGFSAGGALAALAGTRYDAGKADAADPIDRQSSRPDFVVLGYAGLTGRRPRHRLTGRPRARLLERLGRQEVQADHHSRGCSHTSEREPHSCTRSAYVNRRGCPPLARPRESQQRKRKSPPPIEVL